MSSCCEITIILRDECDSRDDSPHVLFKTSFGEQTGPLVKTPQFQGPRPCKSRTISMNVLTATQFLVLTPVFTDGKGNPAKVDGAPKYSCDNTDVLSLEQGELDANGVFTPDANGMSCKVSAVGPLNALTTVTMRADADLGGNVKELFGTAEFSVTAGEATQVVLNTTAPQEQ